MDIVYFLTAQTFYGHRELLYSLRSLEKHITGWKRVFVIGATPNWPHRDLEIFLDRDPFQHNKDANIIRKMMVVCSKLQQLSDPFLFINDDHYFSQRVRYAANWPYFHKGKLPNWGMRDYTRRLANTRRILEKRGLPAWNFDSHFPILIKKDKFLEAFCLDWIDNGGPGVVMKSVYANSVPEIVDQRVLFSDMKITRKKAAGTVDEWVVKLQAWPCWSTGEYVPAHIWEVLERMYPEPSRFEVIA